MNKTLLFLTVNTNTWWKAELHLTNLESCTVWLSIEFHGFTSRINSKGYHCFVPGLISIFLETVWVPLKRITYLWVYSNKSLSACRTSTLFLAMMDMYVLPGIPLYFIGVESKTNFSVCWQWHNLAFICLIQFRFRMPGEWKNSCIYMIKHDQVLLRN